VAAYISGLLHVRMILLEQLLDNGIKFLQALMGATKLGFGICKVVAFGLMLNLLNCTEKCFCEVDGFGITDF
jgi:hypothetical protein